MRTRLLVRPQSVETRSLLFFHDPFTVTSPSALRFSVTCRLKKPTASPAESFIDLSLLKEMLLARSSSRLTGNIILSIVCATAVVYLDREKKRE